MASAACPTCRLALVEAVNANPTVLAKAVDDAAALSPAAISNSYGIPDRSRNASQDSHYNHPGSRSSRAPVMTARVQYPASSALRDRGRRYGSQPRFQPARLARIGLVRIRRRLQREHTGASMANRYAGARPVRCPTSRSSRRSTPGSPCTTATTAAGSSWVERAPARRSSRDSTRKRTTSVRPPAVRLRSTRTSDRSIRSTRCPAASTPGSPNGLAAF